MSDKPMSDKLQFVDDLGNVRWERAALAAFLTPSFYNLNIHGLLQFVASKRQTEVCRTFPGP